MHRRLQDLTAVLLLVAATLLYFGETLRPPAGEIMVGVDLAYLFNPVGRFAFAAFAEGRLPLWNPTLFLGFPQFAEPQLSTFYPPLWLGGILPAAQTFSWLYALHFALTAVGGYVLARQLGGRWSGALLAGIVLAFSAFMAGHLHAGHLPHVMTIAYLPWLLAAAVWGIRPRSPVKMVAATMVTAVPLALAILAGYAPFLPFLVLALTLLMFWLGWQTWHEGRVRDAWRIGLQWMGIGVFAAMLTAVQLLPTLQFVQHSSRAAYTSYSFASSYALPFWNLLTIFWPDLFGAPVGEVPYWGFFDTLGYWEFALYVGILPLILYGLVWSLGEKSWRFWIAISLLGLLIALGANGGLHQVLYQIVPGFGLFRVPARFGYFFMFTAAIWGGLMFDRWFDLPPSVAGRWQPILKRVLISVGVLVLMLAFLAVLWQAGQNEQEELDRIGGIVSQLIRFLVLFGAAMSLLIWGYGRPRWLLALIAIGLVLVDLWGHGRKLVILTTDEPEIGWAMADLALPPDRQTYRVLSDGPYHNQGYLYGFYNVEGYDDLRSKSGLKLLQLARWDARIARLLGIRYFLVGPRTEAMPTGVPGWVLLTQPAGVTIYERDDIQPKAFVVHDVVAAANATEAVQLMEDPDLDFTQTAVVEVIPDTNCALESGTPSAAHVVAYEPDRIVVQTETTVTGWLVFNDLYYPGWQATVSGVPAPVQPTNYALRGVCIPAGTHEVVFTFRPAVLVVGGMVTAVAVSLLIIALAILAFNGGWAGQKGRMAV